MNFGILVVRVIYKPIQLKIISKNSLSWTIARQTHTLDIKNNVYVIT